MLFQNDYSEMAHERIIKAILNLNKEQNIPYGLDKHSDNAKNLISKVFDLHDASIHFVSGGTQANMLVISYFLKPYEGVIACDTGHINVHETAAIEGSGHKVYVVKNKDGKITPKAIKEALSKHLDEHMVKLKMVYISNTTEIGTTYSKKELEDIYKVCKENNLIFFIDGARLGSALTISNSDVTPSILASLCDVFYIGGNKNGLLQGEAIVINKTLDASDFRYHIKNKGAMLAKGFVLGAMFEEAFKDNLYFEMARNANLQASKIRRALLDEKIEIGSSTSNQIFVKLKEKMALSIMNKYGCELWEKIDDMYIIRIVTSWATTNEAVDELINDIHNLNKGE